MIQVWDVNPALAAPVHLKTILTGGLHRADEEAYDAKDHIIMMVDDAEEPFPVAFFYNADTYDFLGKIVFDGTNNTGKAINGLEQAVWDPETNKFLVPVPEISNTPQHTFGEVDVIDPLTLKVVKKFPNEDCAAHGMALGPFQHLLLGCSNSNSNAGAPAVNPLPLLSLIINARNGNLIASIPGAGKADEVWYNAGDGRFYLAGAQLTDGPNPNPPPAGNLTTRVLNVIDAETNSLLQSIPSSPFTGAHSLAAFAENNHVFVPFLSPANAANLDVCGTFGFPGKGCIGVYTHESEVQEAEEARERDR